MSTSLKRKIGYVITILFFGLSMITQVKAQEKIPAHTSQFFVNDYAGILTPETKNYIFETSKKYQNKGGPQVVVTTINSLGGESIEQYSIDMAREWGIGAKKENNGVLILLSVEDRSIRVEVGYGLEGVITDSMAGRFIREVSDELGADDFDTGLLNLYKLVIQELEEPGSFEEAQDKNVLSSIITIIFILVLIFIFSRPSGRGGRGGRNRRHGGYYGGLGGGYGGGGFGGGMGGGGGFSGGGGSFGGGGASGKF